MDKLYYTWKQFDKDVKKIMKLIDFTNYSSLAPVAFGGLILGTKLKNTTKLSTRIIFASSYKGYKKTALKIKTGDLDKLKSKVLIVDDIVDTGSTVLYITHYLDTKKIKYDTLTLFYKEHSVYKPTWYLHKAPNHTWIIMPWEKK